MTANEILAKAKKEVGIKEDPAGSNNVKYNTWFYGKLVSGDAYPWCCVYQSWLFQGTNLVKKTASCSDMLDWCIRNRLIVTEPQPGDLVFFKFGKTSRPTNHIGLVIDASPWEKQKKVRTNEGNTSVTSNDNGGCVMERVRSKSQIVAFARPAYTGSSKTTTVNIPNSQKPVLKMGDKGDWVKVAQARLVTNGFKVTVDGDFGPKTKIAVIAFQDANRLKKDGIIGQNTWAKLYPNG